MVRVRRNRTRRSMAMAQPCCASSFCGHNPGGGAHLASSRASSFVGGSLAFKSHNNSSSLSERGEEERRRRTVGPLSVQAKGRRSPIPGRKPQPMPSLPKVDDDGNPKFVLFIRTKNVCLRFLSSFFFFLWNWFCSVFLSLCLCLLLPVVVRFFAGSQFSS